MIRMRNASLLSCNHPLTELNGEKICLHNIVKWDKHICHFLADRNYVNHSSLFCFTETYTSINSKGIREYLGSWDRKHEHRGHGLAVCYNTAKVEIIKCDFDNLFVDNVFEMFTVGMIIGNEKLLLVLIYRPPSGSKIRFLNHLQDQIDRLPRENYDRLIVLGDFNLDQKDPQHRTCFNPFMSRLDLIQRSTWSTHRYGGILDLIFDSDKSKLPVDWMPSPYSDHFILLVEL